MNNSLSFQDITITSSIGSTRGLLDGQTIYTASSDYESIPLETITGSQGGAFADLSASQKNEFSHRRKAFDSFATFLKSNS